MKLDSQQYMVRELKADFEKICMKNDSFSMRAFAKKLGTNSSTISEIFNKKRKITREKARQFAKALNWQESKIKMMESVFNNKSDLKELEKYNQNELEENIITQDEYIFMYDWRYFALIACLRLKSISPTIQTLANKLGLSVEDTKMLVEKLVQAEFLSMNSYGEITDLKKCFRTPGDYPKELHSQRIIESLNGVKNQLQ